MSLIEYINSSKVILHLSHHSTGTIDHAPLQMFCTLVVTPFYPVHCAMVFDNCSWFKSKIFRTNLNLLPDLLTKRL